MIEKYGWKILTGYVSVSEDIETLRARLVPEVQRIVAARQKEPVSIWNMFALAASAVGGIWCEFSHVKPDGEVKILDGPLSFKRDQDAIENHLRDCLRIAAEDSVIARRGLRDMMSSQRAGT